MKCFQTSATISTDWINSRAQVFQSDIQFVTILILFKKIVTWTLFIIYIASSVICKKTLHIFNDLCSNFRNIIVCLIHFETCLITFSLLLKTFLKTVLYVFMLSVWRFCLQLRFAYSYTGLLQLKIGTTSWKKSKRQEEK